MDTYGIIEKIGKDKIMDKKKNILGGCIFFIAVLSIWAVVSQNKSFSLDVLLEFIKSAKKEWLVAGFYVCLVLYGLKALRLSELPITLDTKQILQKVQYTAEQMYIFLRSHLRHQEDSLQVHIL